VRLILSVLATLLLSSAVHAAQCGGSFDSFVNGLKSEARDLGYSDRQVNSFFSGVAQVISKHRRDHGAKNLKKYKAVFDRIERDYGISRGVLTAFWAFETDFGAFQGDFNTLNALVTLSHDCRRPELFRPQVFAALELFTRGDFDPLSTTGAWAGEIGMVQMLPGDIIESGIDGDGDGQINLKTSAADALLSGAHMLSNLGWRAGQPWLQEVVVPNNLPWGETGLDKQKSVREWQRLGVTPREGRLGDASWQASIILPQGRKGPAFIAYPMKRLQTRLQALGYNVGKVDGILGAYTRAAVQNVQQKLGLPADAWPTHDLLNRL